ncbi:DUF4383 domain-containing protein [Nesterenkonia halotolerans]|uniref:DUF4383 domain-containing protein n=1 Tax=Nesterenkonia halotolerans TaxID=225325 RepID=A0ABR9J860_9MICC|nr:DUF4383 domain-containing protein [Nesterenkonia halotolerans]MBE1515163.1 hypothetical protein [Nesterenkonia halotolerans]
MTLSRRGRRKREAVARVTALVVAAGLLLLGVAGFIPGVADTDQTLAWGEESSLVVLVGVFPESGWGNVVHVVMGLVGLALSLTRQAEASRRYVLATGVLLLIWALVRFIFAVPVAAAPEGLTFGGWLHLGVGAGVSLIGFLLRISRPRKAPEDTRHEEHKAV